MVLLNGPRQVGKDTAANAMMEGRDWICRPVTRQLKLWTLVAHGIDAALLPVYESIKETALPEFGLLSFRQAIIEMSKKVGHAAICSGWMSSLATECEQCEAAGQVVQAVVVPDVRFFEEFAAALDYAGRKNALLMRVYRHGHTWDGDIGSYLQPDAAFGASVTTLLNDWDTIEGFKREARIIAQGFVTRTRTARKRAA